MNKERQYMMIFGATLLATVVAFFSLFEKYSYTTLFYVAEQCYQSLTSFFASPFHLVGLTVFSIATSLSIVFLLKFFFSAWKTQSKLKHFTAQQLKRLPHRVLFVCRAHAIQPTSVLVVKNSQPLAFAMGMFTQRIVITTGLLSILSNKELEAVLLHERYHTLHRHGALIVVAEIISSTLSFFPILQDLLAQMKASFELAADQFAHQKQRTHRHVLTAIQLVITHQHPNDFAPAFGLSVVDQRLHHLSGAPYRRHLFSRWKVGITAASLLMLLGLIVFPTQQYAATASPDFEMGQQCDNVLLCSTQCRDAKLNRPSSQPISLPTQQSSQ